VALVTLAQAREHLETDLVDAALTRLIDAADAEIVAFAGAHISAITTLLYGGGEYLYLTRPAASFTSITEYVEPSDLTGTLLVATDYRVELGGRAIRRLATGTNKSSEWGDRVSIVYIPVAESERRIRVELDLVRLFAKYEALKSEGIGDYEADHLAYDPERIRLLQSLLRFVYA